MAYLHWWNKTTLKKNVNTEKQSYLISLKLNHQTDSKKHHFLLNLETNSTSFSKWLWNQFQFFINGNNAWKYQLKLWNLLKFINKKTEANWALVCKDRRWNNCWQKFYGHAKALQNLRDELCDWWRIWPSRTTCLKKCNKAAEKF